MMSCDANKVSKAQQNVGSSEMLNESAVLLSVKMDDQITSAIIDSRAGPNHCQMNHAEAISSWVNQLSG